MKTLSEKQLAANRANAQKSTGPRTAEGKARAALNSRKHSLTAAYVSMLRLEENGELDNLRADALAHYQPQTSQEIFAVERIAVCQLMMIRGWRLEAGMFIACVDRVLNDDGTPIFRLHADLYPDSPMHTAQNRNYAVAEGFQRMARESPMWSLVLRYQAQVERQYRRAVEELQRLIRERTEDDSPNEPISGPEPEENKPEPTPAGEPIAEPAAEENLRASQPACPRQAARHRHSHGQPIRALERPLTRSIYLDLTSEGVRAAGAPVIIRPSSSKRISYA
jgi:hypothetical protein